MTGAARFRRSAPAPRAGAEAGASMTCAPMFPIEPSAERLAGCKLQLPGRTGVLRMEGFWAALRSLSSYAVSRWQHVANKRKRIRAIRAARMPDHRAPLRSAVPPVPRPALPTAPSQGMGQPFGRGSRPEVRRRRNRVPQVPAARIRPRREALLPRPSTNRSVCGQQPQLPASGAPCRSASPRSNEECPSRGKTPEAHPGPHVCS